MSPRPRIHIFSTGGTVGMLPGNPGPMAPSQVADNLLSYVRGLEREIEVSAESLWNLDSSDMGPAHWDALATAVHARLGASGDEGVRGIVVAHGTDTMAWTASALALALRGLSRPVVLTGAQRPIASVRTDAPENIVNAALCAAMDIPEVSLYFGRFLFRGCRATKTSIQSYEAFESPDCPPLVEMGVEVRPIKTPLRQPGPLRLELGFDPRVLVLPVVPGATPRALEAAVDAGYRGVVVLGFGAGNLPQAGWPGAIRAATDQGVAVVLRSHCHRGRVDLGSYEGGRAALDAGAIPSGAMTLECATVKLMHTLHRAEGEALRALYAADAVGEGT